MEDLLFLDWSISANVHEVDVGPGAAEVGDEDGGGGAVGARQALHDGDVGRQRDQRLGGAQGRVQHLQAVHVTNHQIYRKQGYFTNG